MDNPSPSRLQRIPEILRWRGLATFLVLGVREILRPVVYWYVYHIFVTDLAGRPAPDPQSEGNIESKVYTSDSPSFRQGVVDAAALGEIGTDEVERRLKRGHALAIAYSNGEPAGYGWLAFASGTKEAVRHGNFVHPRWRGKRIQIVVNSAVNEYARQHGVSTTLGSISALNTQSLSLAKHHQNSPAMKVALVHVRPLKWKICRAWGAPCESRFIA